MNRSKDVAHTPRQRLTDSAATFQNSQQAATTTSSPSTVRHARSIDPPASGAATH